MLSRGFIRSARPLKSEYIKYKYCTENKDNTKQDNSKSGKKNKWNLFVNVALVGAGLGISSYVAYDAYMDHKHNLAIVFEPEKDYELCQKCVDYDSSNIKHIDILAIKKNISTQRLQRLLLASLKDNGSNIVNIPVSEWNYELCYIAGKNGFDDLSAIPMIHRDKLLCLKYIENNIYNLRYTPSDIVDEDMASIVKKRIAESPCTARFIPFKYWDMDFANEIADRNPYWAENSIPQLYYKDNVKLCVKVMSYPGSMLSKLPKCMRMMKEVYIPALEANASNISTVISDFKNDIKIIEEACIIALRTDPACYKRIPLEYRNERVKEFAEKIDGRNKEI